MCIFFGFGKKDRLIPCYFSLQSGIESIVLESGVNKLAANCPTTPNHSGVQRRRTYESKAVTLRDTIREEKYDSTQSFSKASHLWWMQHRDSMMKHQNKESRNTDKASPQQWVFKRTKSSESSKKPRIPRAISRIVQFKNTNVNLTFKGLYITKKCKSQRMRKIHSMRLVSSLLGKLLFSSLFPAYC